MNELQIFKTGGVTIVEFNKTKLAKDIWKILKTLIGNPSSDIVGYIK
jgi:hypothetical protein